MAVCGRVPNGPQPKTRRDEGAGAAGGETASTRTIRPAEAQRIGQNQRREQARRRARSELATEMSVVYLEHNGEFNVMSEAPYDAEEVLQRLLAEHPDLIGGDEEQGLILISRELGVPDEEEGSDRWSLDHLFVDRDAIPTLVEVKRSSDTRLRREVVGQMLDYAAQGAAHWSVDSLTRAFTEACKERRKAEADIDPNKNIDLDEFIKRALPLGVDVSPDEFMEQVHVNLRAGRLRLLFVADRIPTELRRVIEFLNENMPSVEVLAVEVRQYVEQGGERRILVPQVIGDTAKGGSSRRRRPWSESELLDAFDKWEPPEEGRRMRMLYEQLIAKGAGARWGRGSVPQVTVWLGEDADPSNDNPVSIALSSGGDGTGIAINFEAVRERRSEDEMQRLAELMQALPGVASRYKGLEEGNWRMFRVIAPADALPDDDAVTKWVDAVVEAARPND